MKWIIKYFDGTLDFDILLDANNIKSLICYGIYSQVSA